MPFRWLAYLLIASLVQTEAKMIRPACAATWAFGSIAVDKIIPLLDIGKSSIDCVEEGIKAVELDEQDQYYVGVGGYPNADGIMELDAAIMDSKRRYGAVMCLQNIKNPISVARSIMEKCVHNILIGNGALQWALSHGFKEVQILTPSAQEAWMQWKQENSKKTQEQVSKDDIDESHDTVGVICLDRDGRLCCGTSTSGWKFKHSGRVGDSPLIGSGLYCDGNVGAAVATGDGEEIMRTCISFLIVEFMRQGHSPQDACSMAIKRFQELEPDFHHEDEQKEGGESTGGQSCEKRMHVKLTVGVVAMDKAGRVGAASTLSESNAHRGLPGFPVVVWRGGGSRRRRRRGRREARGRCRGKEREVYHCR